MENNPPNKKQVDPDAWKHNFLKPLIRDGSRDDFKERESSESNPANYVVEVHQSETYKRVLHDEAISGIIDLRTNNKGKYTIWLGVDHNELMFKAARIPDVAKMSQYLVVIKVKGEKGGKNLKIMRDIVGQSCNRTPGQIDKILDAVDVVLKKTFK